MKINIIFSLVLLFFLSGCDLQSQRQELEKKSQELYQKEQELTLKEQALDQRDSLLTKKQKALDSVLIAQDTLAAKYPNLRGNWTAKMVCTETTCPGWAIGDTKYEFWNITFQDNQIILRATNNRGDLLRIYSGFISQNGRINLRAQTTNTDMTDASGAAGPQIYIRLKQTDPNAPEGQREIVQPNNCHVVYDLKLKKAGTSQIDID